MPTLRAMAAAVRALSPVSMYTCGRVSGRAGGWAGEGATLFRVLGWMVWDRFDRRVNP